MNIFGDSKFYIILAKVSEATVSVSTHTAPAPLRCRPPGARCTKFEKPVLGAVLGALLQKCKVETLATVTMKLLH